MPFLDDLTTMLGGWSDVKQIDKQGFDFREQRRQAELARQQQQQQWEQENQDYATKAMAEASLGGMKELDLASMIPQGYSEAQRKAAIARAVGQSAQAKSSLEAQKGWNEQQIANLRIEAQKEALRNTQEFQRAMQDERIKAQQENRQANEENVWRRLLYTQAEVNRRWGSMPTAVPTGYDQYGQPTFEYRPRASLLGGAETFAKPNPTEQALRTTTEVTHEAMANNLDTLQRQLDEVKNYSGAAALTSPVDAFNARQTYKATLQNMAIQLNRVTGDTSGRYSDVDREVAAKMLGVLNDPLLITNPEMAQKRLDEARITIGNMYKVQQRLRPRAPSSPSMTPAQAETPPASVAPPPEGIAGGLPQPKSRAEYDRLPPGTWYLDPTGKRRRKP